MAGFCYKKHGFGFVWDVYVSRFSWLFAGGCRQLLAKEADQRGETLGSSGPVVVGS